MRSISITRHGGPEVLEMRSAPDPEPGAGPIRVRIKAVGINFADIMMRMGLYPGAPALPFVPGYEAAGVIGLHLGRMTGETEVFKATLTKLVGWWTEGRIRPAVGASFPAEEAGKAHEFIQNRGNTGKVILTFP